MGKATINAMRLRVMGVPGSSRPMHALRRSEKRLCSEAREERPGIRIGFFGIEREQEIFGLGESSEKRNHGFPQEPEQISFCL
jgi:hypothetical protein